MFVVSIQRGARPVGADRSRRLASNEWLRLTNARSSPAASLAPAPRVCSLAWALGVNTVQSMGDLERVKALVARELALVADPARREALRAILVEPRLEEQEWDYGAPGERYPYWVVAEAPARGTVLGYCEQGFGPEFPWGFLFTDDPDFTSLGMDSQWNWYLEEAFVRSGLWSGQTSVDEPWKLPPAERFGAAGSRPDAYRAVAADERTIVGGARGAA